MSTVVQVEQQAVQNPTTVNNNRVVTIADPTPLPPPQQNINQLPVSSSQPRLITHYPVQSQVRRKETLFDHLFRGCCASKSSSSTRNRSYMIVAEEPLKSHNQQQTETAMKTTQQQYCSNSSLVLENRPTGAVIVDSSAVRKVQPKTNGILKTSSAFQKNCSARNSRSSAYYANRTDSSTLNLNNCTRDFSRSSERLVSNNTRQAAVISHHRASSPCSVTVTPQSLPGHRQTTSSSTTKERTTTTTALPINSTTRYHSLRRQKVLKPVELLEVDNTPPSREPIIRTGEAAAMVNSCYSSYSATKQDYYYQHQQTSRSKSRDRQQKYSSYYVSSDPEPCVATATVTVRPQNASSSANFSRSRSVNYRQTSSTSRSPARQNCSPTTVNLTSTLPKRRPPSPVRVSTTSGRTKTPSPGRPVKVHVGTIPPTYQQKPTWKPTNQQGQGESVTVNARPIIAPTPGRVTYQENKVDHSGIPSIPVGSKIDLTMRANLSPAPPKERRTTSSVRYTYETEFEGDSCEDCEECNLQRQRQQQQQAYTKPPSPVPRQSRQQQYYDQKLSNNNYNNNDSRQYGATRVQVGEMGENFQSTYQHHRQETTTFLAKKAQPVQIPIQASLERPEKDGTPVRGQTIVIEKKNTQNKRVLEALAASRRKLEQLDTDLDAALKRLHTRTSRIAPPPPPVAPKPSGYLPYSSSPTDLTLCAEVPVKRRDGAPSNAPHTTAPSTTSRLPMGSNVVLITIADDGVEERFEENEQIIYSRAPPVREVVVQSPPRKVEPPRKRPPITDNVTFYCPKENERPARRSPIEERCPRVEEPPEDSRCVPITVEPPQERPDQFDYAEKPPQTAVVSPHGAIGNIFNQLTHGKLPDFVQQRFNVEHSEEEIHNDDVDLTHADGSNVKKLEDFQNLDTIYEIINMGIENAQAKVCFKVTCQRIEPVNPRAGIWKRKAVTASRVLNIDLSQNDELKRVLSDIQAAPGESVRMIMATDVDSNRNVTTREKNLDTPTTAWAVAEILGKTIDQQGPKPISPRQVEGGPMKFLSPSKFAEEVYNNDILGHGGKELQAVQFSTRRGMTDDVPPWARDLPPPAYRTSRW